MKRLVLILSLPIALIAMISVQMAQAGWVQSAIQAATTAPSTQPRSTLAQVLEGNGQLRVEQFWDTSFWTQAVHQFTLLILGFIPRVIVAILLFAIFYVIYRVVRKVTMSSMKAAGLDESIRDMLCRMLKIVILGFGLVIACNQIGIEIAALLTGVSIIGLAVGFAAQESISNFIAGVMIFLDKPFKPGDWINVDGHTGQVKRVTFRSTRMIDLEGDTVIFPNTAMLNRKLVNKSVNPITRITVTLPIPAHASIDEARRVLLGIMGQDSRVEKRPDPEVVAKSIDSGTVTLLIQFWIREERYEDAMTFEYLERAKNALDKSGITRARAT